MERLHTLEPNACDRAVFAEVSEIGVFFTVTGQPSDWSGRISLQGKVDKLQLQNASEISTRPQLYRMGEEVYGTQEVLATWAGSAAIIGSENKYYYHQQGQELVQLNFGDQTPIAGLILEQRKFCLIAKGEEKCQVHFWFSHTTVGSKPYKSFDLYHLPPHLEQVRLHLGMAPDEVVVDGLSHQYNQKPIAASVELFKQVAGFTVIEQLVSTRYPLRSNGSLSVFQSYLHGTPCLSVSGANFERQLTSPGRVTSPFSNFSMHAAHIAGSCGSHVYIWNRFSGHLIGQIIPPNGLENHLAHVYLCEHEAVVTYKTPDSPTLELFHYPTTKLP